MLDQKFVDAVYHLGKFVTDNENCVLEVIVNGDVAVVHLIPVDLYQDLSSEEDDEDEVEDQALNKKLYYDEKYK